MATKKTTYKKVEVKDYDGSLSEADHILADFKLSYDYYHPIRSTWAAKEALVLCKLEDSISKNSAKSQVFDPRLLTMISEKMYRINAQLASGKVKAPSRKYQGKASVMDLLLQKYIVPNANTQYDLLTKNRMVDFHSDIYGSFPVFIDWFIKDDYIGPDYQMIPPRDFVPQPGKYSVNDCEYVYFTTRVSKKWLMSRSRDTWKNIDKLLEASKGKTPIDKKSESKTYAETQWGSSYAEDNKSAQPIELITKVTPDRWITVAADYPGIPPLRDIENPHKNGKLPFAIKHAFPLLDRFFGLGVVEKGYTLQMATNSLINLYLDGVKWSVVPGYMYDPTGIITSTFKIEAGAKWAMKRMDAVAPIPVNPRGLDTFQSTYSFMVSAMLNMGGTTDTTVGDDIETAMGKTPAAVNFMSQRQNSSDAFGRFMCEKFTEEVYDRFIDLVAVKQEKPIKLDLFEDELQQIVKSYPEIMEEKRLIDDQLLVEPGDFKEINFKYQIDAGSTYKKEEAMEKGEIEAKMAMIMQMPNAQEQIAQTGGVFLGKYFIDFAEMFKRSVITGGVHDWDKIVRDKEDKMAELQEEQANQPVEEDPMQDPNFVALMQEVQASGAGLPQQDMGGGMPMGQPQMPQQPPMGGMPNMAGGMGI